MDMREAARVYGGLTGDEVAASRSRHGANTISRKKTKGFFGHLLGNFGDPIIKILLIALGVNMLLLFRQSDWYETAGIAAAVLTAVIISTLSERGSESAFKRLQSEAAAIRCRVIRGGVLTELPVGDIVVGDLISLQAGDRVPADGPLVHGRTDVDQSTLNGETAEAKKTAGHSRAPAQNPLSDPHMLFCGTVVCAGEGIMRAEAIGDGTFYGKLAGEVQEQPVESPLKLKLGALAGTISRFGYIGAGLVAFAYLFNVMLLDNRFSAARIMASLSNPSFVTDRLLHAVMLAVTVIVVAVPEGLPMMITVVLSSNMKRMLKDNVLVRKLVGIETAGSLNILFTDKTGTLTRGKLQVTGIIDGKGKLWNSAGRLRGEALWSHLHRAVAYNSMSSMSEISTAKFAAIGGNPTDRALLEYVSAYPVKHNLTRVDVQPFDSARKYMASQVAGDFNGVLIKGAPESILPRCTEFISADGRVFPFSMSGAVIKQMEEAQNNAARLIAIAVSEGGRLPGGENLRLIGIAAVRDDVRREALEGIRQIRRAGVGVVMITGDSKATAQAIARRVGLLDDGAHV
ncbi:MAG: HAD family hydrolase, partial [Oscillospiraceae bacterium]|nr:HAD family hydrolase [Oscillospiraceae bacterium]